MSVGDLDQLEALDRLAQRFFATWSADERTKARPLLATLVADSARQADEAGAERDTFYGYLYERLAELLVRAPEAQRVAVLQAESLFVGLKTIDNEVRRISEAIVDGKEPTDARDRGRALQAELDALWPTLQTLPSPLDEGLRDQASECLLDLRFIAERRAKSLRLGHYERAARGA